MKNDVSHGEILAGDHAEDKQSDEQFELMKSLDMDADAIKMSQGKDQTGENQSMAEIQMQPSLEDDIKKENSKHKFFYDRNQNGLPQDDQNLQEADLTGTL
jgi:curved DNA-binding protein CbpA